MAGAFGAVEHHGGRRGGNHSARVGVPRGGASVTSRGAGLARRSRLAYSVRRGIVPLVTHGVRVGVGGGIGMSGRCCWVRCPTRTTAHRGAARRWHQALSLRRPSVLLWLDSAPDPGLRSRTDVRYLLRHLARDPLDPEVQSAYCRRRVSAQNSESQPPGSPTVLCVGSSETSTPTSLRLWSAYGSTCGAAASLA